MKGGISNFVIIEAVKSENTKNILFNFQSIKDREYVTKKLNFDMMVLQ